MDTLWNSRVPGTRDHPVKGERRERLRDRRTNGWMNVWERSNREIDGQIGRQTDRTTDRQIERQKDRQTDRQMHIQTDEQMDFSLSHIGL